MNNPFRVVGIGLVLVDHVVIVPHIPLPNTKVAVKSSFDQIGGPVPTALMYLHQLGCDVRIVSAIGNDMEGMFIKEVLSKTGIHTSGLVMQKRRSAFAHVWIDSTSGERTIAYNTGDLQPLGRKEITEELLQGARFLHIDAREPELALYSANLAHKMGIQVVFDTGDLKPQSRNLLKIADVVISPKRFSEELFGESDLQKATEKIKSLGPEIVVVTDGENGFAYASPEGQAIKRSYKIIAKDTTGAGDIFSGALIYGLLNKITIDKATSFASAAAAIKCTQVGKNKLPSKDEVFQFMFDNTTST